MMLIITAIFEEKQSKRLKAKSVQDSGTVTIIMIVSEIYCMTPFAFPRVCQSLCTRFSLFLLYTTHFSEKRKSDKVRVGKRNLD